jgi:hypothetical protein
LALAVIDLVIRIVGYAEFEDADAYVNAAMILSGMGPTAGYRTEAAGRCQRASALRHAGNA